MFARVAVHGSKIFFPTRYTSCYLEKLLQCPCCFIPKPHVSTVAICLVAAICMLFMPKYHGVELPNDSMNSSSVEEELTSTESKSLSDELEEE